VVPCIDLDKDIIFYSFFFLTLNFKLQSSEPLRTKMPRSNLLLLRYTVCIESCLSTVFAGTLLFDEKIHQSAVLFWFGLRDVGILQIFYSPTVLQGTIVDSPAFLELSLAEKIALCVHPTRMPKK
jgi:hypothetical protein